MLRFEVRDPSAGSVLEPVTSWSDKRGRQAGPVIFTSGRFGRPVSADASGAIIEWDPETGRARHSIHVGGRLTRVALAGEGRVLTLATGEPARIWDLAAGREVLRLPSGALPLDAALRDDGGELVVPGRGQDLHVWELPARRRRIETTLQVREAASRVGLLPDGRVLLGYNSGSLRLLTPGRGRTSWEKRVGTKAIVSLEILEGGQRAHNASPRPSPHSEH